MTTQKRITELYTAAGLLHQHHEVESRQNPENYNYSDLGQDTERALRALGHKNHIPLQGEE